MKAIKKTKALLLALLVTSVVYFGGIPPALARPQVELRVLPGLGGCIRSIGMWGCRSHWKIPGQPFPANWW